MKLEKRAKYRQPHNIKIEGMEYLNEAMIKHLTIKAHHRDKYLTSKWRKRMYHSKN